MITYKNIEINDMEFIREMLYQAVFIPVESARPVKDVLLAIPEIKRYYKYLLQLGAGIIMLEDSIPIGAAWYITFPENDRGYGFVENDIPELTMALLKEYRGRGYGTKMLEQLIGVIKDKGFSGVSLSVEDANPAVGLYEKFGFVKVRKDQTSDVMVLYF